MLPPPVKMRQPGFYFLDMNLTMKLNAKQYNDNYPVEHPDN
jgi:hypothetical protein